MKTYCIDVPVMTYANVRVNGNTPEEALKSLMKNGEYIDWEFHEGSDISVNDMLDWAEWNTDGEFYCYCDDDETECYVRLED